MSHLNPISKWEEQIEIQGLTLFDIHRKPRKVNRDNDAIIKIPLKVLSAEFQCPICLGYMKKTCIVMECLHRFCGECIQKCLRVGKKECPSCRVHIPSRRNLRPDHGFDNLIQNIYGDITALEKQEEQEIEKLNRDKHMNNAYAESRMRGILNQAIQRRKPKTVAGVKRKASLAASSLAAHEDGNFPNLKESTLVQYVLRRHPREALVDRLDRECLKTSKNVSVGVVKLFLSRKLSYEPISHFQITIEAGGKEILLDNSITIEEILRDLSDEGISPLVLNYGIGRSVNVKF
uniref:RING-type E3 ubiquitin transferase n=1 Tax=Attheya septentrionalis TaxID=420275 RepID=A0A7S2UQJ8_9STRA|eukprot:CAMPEP_0198283574 /NCGR_PEP_ID=MMETSP1449-20131203/3148_1 /TAXON_ID=420275 /ORGANISM="Attheya septentrionalis, Strain CCMP2084" /LENGTH=290 /DNA_ID=CAMNT_0043980247 /DNA_START=104 /DNA_END=976 /DNA_ORIENTATION=+